jgi:hypothetical protein
MDALETFANDPSMSGNAVADDSSELDSLSDFLGGPYQLTNRPDELEEVPISSLIERSRITRTTPQSHINQNLDKRQMDFDFLFDDEKITEEELRSYGGSTARKLASQRSSKLWKRQLNFLMPPRSLSWENTKHLSGPISQVYDDEIEGGGELLEYGGNAVVIHCVTQEIARHRPESSDKKEKAVVNFSPDTSTVKSPSRLDRWKEGAYAWKRAVNLRKFFTKKISAFDDLSTDSSSDSEVIMKIGCVALKRLCSLTNFIHLLPRNSPTIWISILTTTVIASWLNLSRMLRLVPGIFSSTVAVM